MRTWTFWALLVAVHSVSERATAQDAPTPDALAPGMSWQDAVGELAGERTRAETCVSLLKRYGDAAEIAEGQLAYGDAKADIDGLIAGLQVALAQRAQPEALADLEARLARGVAWRTALCEKAVALVPPVDPGSRSLISDVLKEVIGPLSAAIGALYNDHREDEALERATIATQLEAAAWPPFSAID